MFDFALDLKKSEQVPFLQAILLLPLSTADDDVERYNYLMVANNAINYFFNKGDWQLSAKIADTVIDYVSEDIYIAHNAACAFAQTGQIEKALDMVELAVKHEYVHLEKLKFDPDLAPIKDEPRLKALVGHPKQRKRPDQGMFFGDYKKPAVLKKTRKF